MLRSTALLLVAVLASVAASAAERPACELLTLEEVGRAAGAAVAIDKSASGEDDRGGDNCVWKAGSQVVAEMRIQRLASAPEGRRAFSDARTEAFGARPAPAPVAGLGDEALYRDFERAKGGALIVRRGAVVVGMSGSLPRNAYLALARLLLPRL
jgi:hypothetical protein